MSEPVYFKVSCGACDGHIAYPETSVGMTVACPHCSKDVFLPNPAVIAEPPRFVVEPHDARIPDGGYARFTAKAEGVPSPTYQWFLIGGDQTGRPLAGETKPDLVIITPPVGTTQYLVTATNNEGAVQSQIATLTVEQKIKLEKVSNDSGLVTPSKEGKFNLFKKIRSRADAHQTIGGIGWLFFVFSWLFLVLSVLGKVMNGSFNHPMLIGVASIAFFGAALCWFNSRIIAVILLLQYSTAVLLLGVLGWQEASSPDGDIVSVGISSLIAVLLLVIAVRAVGATFLFHGKYKSQIIASMRPTGQCVTLLTTGCVALAMCLATAGGSQNQHRASSVTGDDTADLQAKIRQNIEKYFSQKPDLANVQINDFKLFHKSGNKYDGTLFYQLGSKVGQSDVDVTYDGSSFKWKIAPADSPTANPSTVHRLGTAAGAWSVRFGEDLADTKGISLYDFLLTDTDGTIGGHVDALNPGGEMVEGARSGNRIEFHCQMKSLRGDIYSLKFTGTVNRNSMSGEVAIKNETSTSWKNDVSTTLWNATAP